MGKTRFQQALTGAAICALAVIAAHVGLYASDMLFGWFGLLLRIVLFVTFTAAFIGVMLSWKKTQEEISYGKAFVFGLMVLGMYLVITFAYELVFYLYVEPDYYQKLADKTLQGMIEMKAPDTQVLETKKQFEMGREYSTPAGMSISMLVQRLIGNLIILSIVAIFTRKEKTL